MIVVDVFDVETNVFLVVVDVDVDFTLIMMY